MRTVATSSSCVKRLCAWLWKNLLLVSLKAGLKARSDSLPSLFQPGVSPKIVSKPPVLLRGMGSHSEGHPAMPERLQTMEKPAQDLFHGLITPIVKNHLFLERASL